MGGWSTLKRLARYLWWEAGDSRRLVSPAVAERLAQRIADGERRHTGELRVCVEASPPWHWWWPVPSDEVLPARVHERALSWFGQLRIWDTRDNNGVLIYVLLADRSLEIVADRGLSQHVPPEVWAGLLARLREAWRHGEVEAGLTGAIDAVNALLVEHFPADDRAPKPNELPDSVVLC